MKELYKEVKRVEQNLSSCADHLQNIESLAKKFTPVEEEFRLECNKKDFYDDDERERSFLETISILS